MSNQNVSHCNKHKGGNLETSYFIKFHDSSLLNVKLKVITLSLTLSYNFHK